MIDLRQIGAIQESYLKERWIRMNWRKNYRKQMAEKLKFRTEEIEEAKRIMNSETAVDPPVDKELPADHKFENSILEDIENSRPNSQAISIKIPTEKSSSPDPDTKPPTITSNRPPTAVVKCVSSRNSVRTASRASARTVHEESANPEKKQISQQSERLHRLQSPKVVIPGANLKPTETIRQQLDSASQSKRRFSKEIQRPKSTHISSGNNRNMVLSGTQISLNNREALWKNSVGVNKNSPRTTRTYLRARTALGPEQKYDYPYVSSYNYGWRLNDHIKEYRPSDHGRSQIIQSTFYRGNTAFMEPHKLY